MDKLLHLSKLDVLLEQKEPMDITFVKRSTGEIVEAKGVIVTSIYGKEGTCNIEFPNGEKRTVRKCLIQKVNHIKIFF
jgi:hypothetical protein